MDHWVAPIAVDCYDKETPNDRDTDAYIILKEILNNKDFWEGIRTETEEEEEV